MKLTLILPGLSGTGVHPAPVLPALGRWLARSDHRREPRESLALLFGQFGLHAPGDGDLPSAAVARLGEGGATLDDAYWLHADPVHLRVNASGMALYGAPLLQVAAEEAAALVESFNQALGGSGMRLEAPAPDRWYLRLGEAPELCTVPLAQVAGRDLHRRLPTGADAARFHRLLNEVQMLFHDHPLNRAREEAGRPPINSLWLWGGGRMPAPLRAPDGVWSDGPAARGLAELAAAPLAGVPADAEGLLAQAAGGSQLVELAALHAAALYGDEALWDERLAELERTWFAPLLRALERGRLAQLTLLADGHGFRLGRLAARRFWRRPRPLAGWFGTPPEAAA